MPISLRQLRYFVTVAEEGQVTRAARRLHLAQPALSQAIAQLELELGLQLLERHARGVTVTSAGQVFLAKARTALQASEDAAQTAASLARAATDALDIGFIGPPPEVKAPELLAAFSDAHPEAHVSFRALQFPTGSTAVWLQEVDVALCHPPEADPGVRTLTLRSEPRVAVVPKRHRLADRAELEVADLIDETFIAYNPVVQQTWAGFHSLDDHRGMPAAYLTEGSAVGPGEMLVQMTERRAITTLPAGDAAIIPRVLRGVVTIPVRDAAPASLALMWRADNQNPRVKDVVAVARALAQANTVEAPRAADAAPAAAPSSVTAS
jgi:DNA-binding transcriptional LysR family regulator